MSERPFVLVGQQYLADLQRSVRNTERCGARHVANDYAGDPIQAIITPPTTQPAGHNPNYGGGGIIMSDRDIRQLLFGPRITLSQ